MTDPSLLLYLDGADTPFRLVFSDEPGGIHSGNPPRFPFQIINDKSPLTRILRARVTSDAGSTVRPVALMLSRDDYPLLEDAAAPVTNRDIDSIWQQAYQSFRDSDALIVLRAHGADQTLRPFRSLFYCTRTETFFHPLCPRCGQTLELCRDDAILEDSGLKPYSTSLKRYLACPACIGSGENRVFYSRVPDDADPACVKGRSELITGLLQLTAGDLVCARCPERPSCSGEGLGHTRIVPVAFYPFHLLMFEAPSLNAEDYLALVSGVRPAELEGLLAKERLSARSRSVGLLEDRAGQLVLFGGDERRFLEVLFLKLSLLGEIAQHTLSGEGMGVSPRFGPSLESLWVRTPHQSSLLPALWSFRLAVMDIGLDVPGKLPLEGEGYEYRILGALWFQALLKNNTQDKKAVNERIGRILREKSLDRSDAAFEACNVFWNPEPVPESWSEFWNGALELGRDLLTGMSSPDAFWNAFHGLRDGIRKELFTGAAPAGEPCRQDSRDDEQIGLIIRQIRSRMGCMEVGALKEETLIPERASSGETRADGDATVVIPSTGQAAEQSTEGEYEKTMILKGQGDERKITEEPEEDFRTETILMKHTEVSPIPDASATLGPETGKGILQEPDPGETALLGRAPAADFDKTAVIAGKPAADLGKTMVKGSRPEADLEETIVMGAGAAGQAPDRKGPDEKTAQADLEATVIMGSAAVKTPAPAQKPPAADAPDDLAETIIMTPKKK